MMLARRAPRAIAGTRSAALRGLVACGAVFALPSQAGTAGEVQELPPIPSTPANVGPFATPLALGRDRVFTINVEPANGGRLATVVRSHALPTAFEGGGESGEWLAHEIDDDTFDDRYHTQASLGVDSRGVLHAAFNMHNAPWQYAVATAPASIADWRFLGEALTPALRAELRANRSHGRGVGTAALPGRSITYPRFTAAPERLWISFRHALFPDADWPDRGLAAGIAGFDPAAGRWEPLGAAPRAPAEAGVPGASRVAAASAFAYDPDWVPYHVHVAPARDGGLHVAWSWRAGGPGPAAGDASYVRIDRDGRARRSDGVSLPYPLGHAAPERLDSRETPGSRAVITALQVRPDDTPVAVVERDDGRYAIAYDPARARWATPERLPSDASALLIAPDGREWAIASGPRVYTRRAANRRWDTVLDRTGLCHPKAVADWATGVIALHLMSCDEASVRVLVLRTADRR